MSTKINYHNFLLEVQKWRNGAHLAKKKKIQLQAPCVRSMWKHFNGAEGENKRDQSQTVYKQCHDKHEKAYF